MSKIERGEREIRRLDLLVEVARALRVTLGDLLGEPVLLEDEHKNDDVPAIRDALMAPQRLSKTLFGGSVEPEYVDPQPVAQWTEDAWSNYQGGRIGRVVTALPRLIKTAQQMESAGGDGSYKRRWRDGVGADSSSGGHDIEQGR